MKPDQEFVETAQHFSEEAVSLYGKSRTGLLLYRVIVILSGLFFIGLILWDGFGNTGKDSHQMMLLLTFLTLALGLLLFHTGMEYGRMYRAIARSPRVLYDYLRPVERAAEKAEAEDDPAVSHGKVPLFSRDGWPRPETP